MQYARPYSSFIPQYTVASVATVLLSIANFTLLIPMLEVLFGTVGEREVPTAEPAFALSIDYVKTLFYYHIFQVMQAEGKLRALLFICAFLIATSLGKNAFRYLSMAVLAKTRARLIRKLRNHLYSHITKLHLGYFTEQRKGDLTSRATNDIQEVENSFVNSITTVLREPPTIIGYFVTLMIISFKLTLFTLIVLPVSGFFIGYITKKLRKHTHRLQNELGNVLNILDETLSGIKVIKAFNAQSVLKNKFERSTRNYSRSLVAAQYKREMASPMSEFLGVAVVTGILYYGGLMVISGEGELSAAAFIAYLGIFSQIMNPAKAITTAIGNIQRGLIAGERVFAVLDEPIKVPETVSDQRASFGKSLELKNVSFAYQPDTPVLQNIDLKINKGETVALVGPSGGGKSTLADLLPRFYDPTEGQILLDGIDIRKLDMLSLRAKLGVVTQESFLFHDSVYNNIAFGVGEVTEEQVHSAARTAHAHGFISELPEGYNTLVGERGARLSGGQRQRLSIARAVLRNPELLILDEATSALDTESEKLVQEALLRLLEGRTSVVIAHRLSTILHADKIVVIDRGRIVEQGTHHELLQIEGGLYSKLSNLQQAGV